MTTLILPIRRRQLHRDVATHFACDGCELQKKKKMCGYNFGH